MYEHIASQLFGRPLMVEPHRAKVMVSALADRLAVDSIHADDGNVIGRQAMQAVSGHFDYKAESLMQVVDGIAVIDVAGTITHKFGHLNPSSGMVGLDGLQAKIESADADPDVRGILLDFDSPGGSVSGTFDLADLIASIDTPIWSLVDELAASAAYALAAATDRIVAPRTAQIGSIGVIAMHEDISGALEKEGRRITLITAGARKAEGNSLAPLPDDVRERMQSDVDEVYGLFVNAVARYRGLSASAVRATEAGVFNARQALDNGLIDAVMPAHDVLEAFDNVLRQSANPIQRGFNAMALSLFGRKQPKVQAAPDGAADNLPDAATLSAVADLANAGFDAESEAGNITSLAVRADAETVDIEALMAQVQNGKVSREQFSALLPELAQVATGQKLYTEAEAREAFAPADTAASLESLVDLCGKHACADLAQPLRDRGMSTEVAEQIMADVDDIRDKATATFPDDKQAASQLAENFIHAAYVEQKFGGAFGSLMVEASARMSGEEIDHHQPDTAQAAGKGAINAHSVHKRHNARK